MDWTTTQLNPWQMYAMDRMHVTLFTDKVTGKTFIHKQYWNGITDQHRQMLTEVLEVFANSKTPAPMVSRHE